MDEAKLIEKLRLIEALHAGATTPGERDAAGQARERIRARLAELGKTERATETRFKIPDPWSQQLFLALARRYGLAPYRYPRQRKSTIYLRAPRQFIDQTVWPAYCSLDDMLQSYLRDVTNRVISQAIYAGSGDAEEVAGTPSTLGPGAPLELGSGRD